MDSDVKNVLGKLKIKDLLQRLDITYMHTHIVITFAKLYGITHEKYNFIKYFNKWVAILKFSYKKLLQFSNSSCLLYVLTLSMKFSLCRTSWLFKLYHVFCVYPFIQTLLFSKYIDIYQLCNYSLPASKWFTFLEKLISLYKKEPII